MLPSRRRGGTAVRPTAFKVTSHASGGGSATATACECDSPRVAIRCRTVDPIAALGSTVAAAGGGDSTKLSAKQQVSISYGEDAKPDDFAVIMVGAQHLEAWKRLFAPKRENDIPSLDDVLAQL